MDVTTLDRLRAWFHDQELSETSLPIQLMKGLSASIENYMGRYLESTSRTTYCDVNPGDRVFFLRGYPISSSGLTIYSDLNRAFTGSALDASLYDTTARALNEGRIEFVWAPVFGRQVGLPAPSALKITYTGGLAASTAALISAYPDLVSACEQQIVYMVRNPGLLGLDSSGGGQLSEVARRQISLLTWWEKHGELLPDVVRVLRSYKSFVPRW